MDKNEKHINNWNLPEHQPDPELWEKIEKGLDDAVGSYVDYKEFLTVLPVHKPAPGLWNNIANNLGKKPVLLPFGGYLKYAVPVILLLLSGILLYYFINYPVENLTNSKNRTTEINFIEQQSDNRINDDSRAGFQPENNDTNGDKALENKAINRKDINHIPESDFAGNKTDVNPKNTFGSSVILNTNNPLVTQKTKDTDYKPLDAIIPVTCNKINLPEPQIMERIVPVSRFDGFTLFDSESVGENGSLLKNFYTGIHFNPELLYHRNGDVEIKRAYGFGVDVGYKFSGLFLESGMELSFTQDDGTYQINYLQNEIINTYTKVDSVIYEYDTISQSLSKEYVTSDIDVYDSVEYLENRQAVNRYTYLRLPLMIGYKFDYKRVSFFIKAGTEFSLLVRGEEPVPTVNGKEIRIINVEKESPDRVSTNWQMIVSAGIGIRVYKSMTFTLEPQYRYYLNSYYSQQMSNYKKQITEFIKRISPMANNCCYFFRFKLLKFRTLTFCFKD